MRRVSPCRGSRIVGLLPALLLSACGSSGPASTPEGDSGAAPDTGAFDGAPLDTGNTDSPTSEAGSLDSGSPDGGPMLTPADIQFAAVNPLPKGEQILFNDWQPSPNDVNSLTPDGKTKTEIFRIYRAWSMGVSHDASRIAFSSGDPNQQQDFGLQILDSIQWTWMYDAGMQTISLVASGNINDECHAFGPGDTKLWICRRYDFTETGDGGSLTGTNKGYRLGQIDLPANTFTFMSPDDPNSLALGPQPTPDGMTLYFSTIANQSTRTINAMPLPSGAPALVRSSAGGATLSPDGTRYVYDDYTDSGALYASSLNGASTVKLTSERGMSPSWSPDGTRVAYLVFDNAASCSHIDVVKADGSQAASPTRLRDCSQSHEFITRLAWVIKP